MTTNQGPPTTFDTFNVDDDDQQLFQYDDDQKIVQYEGDYYELLPQNDASENKYLALRLATDNDDTDNKIEINGKIYVVVPKNNVLTFIKSENIGNAGNNFGVTKSENNNEQGKINQEQTATQITGGRKTKRVIHKKRVIKRKRNRTKKSRRTKN